MSAEADGLFVSANWQSQLPVNFRESLMGNAARERHAFHIVQRLPEAENISVIEDDGPNRTLLRKALYGLRLGSIMHKSDNTSIYVHNKVYSCTREE